MKHSKFLVCLAFVALAAVIPATGFTHHGGFVHEDGALETANWEEAVQVYGVDGSGGGTSRQVGSGGSAYREISVNRSPITADPSNATHLYQFFKPYEYDPGTMGAIGMVDIGVEARKFEGEDGMVAAALRQNGIYYVSEAKVVFPGGADFGGTPFFGLKQNSFSEVGAPNSHPDFSATGAAIVFGYVYMVTATTEESVESTGGIDHWLLRMYPRGEPEFLINAGLNDAWYFAGTPGQGFFTTVYPELGVIFLAWFTYDTERPDAGVAATVGEPGHRWLTAIGEYAGDTAVLDVELTSGGVFDSADPMPVQDPNYGTITIVFNDCNSATLTYQFSSPGLMGEIPLTRIANDNVAICEALLAEILGQ